VAGGVLVAAALVVVSTSHDQHGPVRAAAHPSAAPADHAAELARDQAVLTTALPTAPSTQAVWGASGFPTGADTPDGWQVQGHTSRISGQAAAVGNRQLVLVCAGRGTVEVDVAVDAADGSEVSRQAVPATCAADGGTAAESFTVPDGGAAYTVQIRPAADAVGMLGYRVT
jgi:hypothetical protein